MKSIVYSSFLTLTAVLLTVSQVSAQEPAPPGAKESPADAAITASIYSSFSSDPQLNGSLINVFAKNGVVQVRGITPTPQAKADAIGMVSRTPGVRLVQDGLEVGKIPAPKKPSQGE